MRARVYGTGCRKCRGLHANAVAALGEESVEYVTDVVEMAAGVMSTPALEIDGKVVSTGRVLGPEEIARLAECGA